MRLNPIGILLCVYVLTLDTLANMVSKNFLRTPENKIHTVLYFVKIK